LFGLFFYWRSNYSEIMLIRLLQVKQGRLKLFSDGLVL
jgi:hypothetical protein